MLGLAKRSDRRTQPKLLTGLYLWRLRLIGAVAILCALDSRSAISDPVEVHFKATPEMIVSAFFGGDGRGNFARQKLSRWEKSNINIHIYLAAERGDDFIAEAVHKYQELLEPLGKSVKFCPHRSAHPTSDSEGCRTSTADIILIVPDEVEDLSKFFSADGMKSINEAHEVSIDSLMQSAITNYVAGKRCDMQFVDNPKSSATSLFIAINGVSAEEEINTWSNCLSILTLASVGVFPAVTTDPTAGFVLLPRLLPVLYSPVMKSGMTQTEVRSRLIITSD